MPDKERVAEALRACTKPVSVRELANLMGLTSPERRDLRTALKYLEREGRARQLSGRLWVIPRPTAVRSRASLVGTLSITRRGMGFVRLDAASAERTGERDVMIPERYLADAMDGDRVEVEILDREERGPRGRIVEVLRRARTVFVGQYRQTSPTRGEVVPRNAALQRRISVPIPDKRLEVRSHEWVSVEITEFTPHPEELTGVVVARLGASHDKGIDVLLLLRDRGIAEEFPHAVEEEAAALSDDLASEARERLDLRELPTITIDPATAKDFDDAISCESLGPGQGWRLWVHIADVTHYVRPGMSIDFEARERSTSVYPVDRVVPMLPERLANDLCSLKPNVDRLAVTAEMVIEADGTLGEAQFHSTIIHSRRRFAYEEAQKIVADEADAPPVTTEVRALVLAARDCARALRTNRKRRGGLDLDIPELVIRFHEEGQVRDMSFGERFEAHRLIEDCMLAANEAVAEYLKRRGAPFLYRIHEQAEPDRLENLVPMLGALGVKLPVSKGGKIEPKSLQAVLATLEGKRGGHILRRLVLRALKRAEYSPSNVGHFGLASKTYCHFTSPIRRYPDVVVHRQVKALERGAPLVWSADEDGVAELTDLGRHCSWRERQAQEAERDSSAIKAIEFLKRHEGDEFDGLISSVQGFGLFVELDPWGVEGLVPIRSMHGDRYYPDELGVALVGQSSGRRYRLTDKVRVRIVRASPFEMSLDLELLDEGGTQHPFLRGGPRARPQRRNNHPMPKGRRGRR